MRTNVLSAVFFAGLTVAKKVTIDPVGLDPGDWLGIDGNWSTVRFLVGSPVQPINVLVSTSLSEFWAIARGGCPERDVLCATARGGLYRPRESKHWTSIGIWQLGLSYLGYDGNGRYGLDTIGVWNPITNIALNMPKALMSAINTTDYYIGLFGLGLTQGTFGHKSYQSPLTDAVKTYGWIPSYTYGYTAGASYNGAPVSMTLGGLDISRLQPHQVEFVLSPDNLPRALVRGIQVDALSAKGSSPRHWDSPTSLLSTWDDTFTALIDSTTPYLWLPEPICDKFAKTFNLTYNKTFELYTLTNDQYRDFMAIDPSDFKYNFTFSFSSIDNHDNFGRPLDVPGVVNITLPIQAFVGLLQHPFMHAIGYGDPAVPYFALKKATNSSSIIIGRSFLQEAYILTKYDYGIFKLFKARYSSNRLAKLVPVKQPNGSLLAPPAKQPGTDGDFTKGEVIGIVIGTVAASLFCFLAVYWLLRRRRRRQQAEVSASECKDSASTASPDPPQSSVSRVLSKFTRKKRYPRNGSESRILDHPAEVPNSEIYELPVAPGPVELDAAEDDASILDGAEIGTHDGHTMYSPYELARMKIDRQLQGPVPEYSPPADGVYFPPEKKMYPDPSPPPAAHSPEETIQISPNGATLGNNSLLLRTLPSPVSPRSDSGNPGELPSPATAYISSHISGTPIVQDQLSPRQVSPYGGSRQSRPNSSYSSAAQSHSSAIPPIPSRPFQKDPIDPTNIVCLGELPDSLQLLRQNIASQVGVADGQGSTAPRPGGRPQPHGHPPGSFFIDDGDSISPESARSANVSQNRIQASNSGAAGHPNFHLTISTQGLQPSQHPPSPSPQTAVSEERMNGRDLVHVPQMAATRYSWEN